MRGKLRNSIRLQSKQIFSFGELKEYNGDIKQSVINHGLMRNVQNWLIEGGRQLQAQVCLQSKMILH
jgi:hypothetical protein